MQRRCAWCQSEIAGADDRDSTAPVTHGICAACLASQFGEQAHTLRAFLDRFDEPILLIDGDAQVRMGNKRARDLVGPGLSLINGGRIGDVVECSNAALAGGCGQQVGCMGCALRTAIAETLATGEPRRNVVQQEMVTASVSRLTDVTIATELLGEMVLLRIDEAQPGAAD